MERVFLSWQEQRKYKGRLGVCLILILYFSDSFFPLIHLIFRAMFIFLFFPLIPSSTDPKICTLTPNGHLDMSLLSPGLFPGERLTFALGSRKNSVISLGRADLEKRAVVSGRKYTDKQQLLLFSS